MRFLECGESEHVKAGFHLAIGALLVGAFVYNVSAYFHRRNGDKRLLTNAIIYGAGIGLEAVQVARHVGTIRRVGQ